MPTHGNEIFKVAPVIVFLGTRQHHLRSACLVCVRWSTWEVIFPSVCPPRSRDTGSMQPCSSGQVSEASGSLGVSAEVCEVREVRVYRAARRNQRPAPAHTHQSQAVCAPQT